MPMIDVSDGTMESITEIKRLIAVLDDAGRYQIMTATDASGSPRIAYSILVVMDRSF